MVDISLCLDLDINNVKEMVLAMTFRDIGLFLECA